MCIEYVPDSDTETNNFLKDCIPDKLQFLWFNYSSVLKWIKSAFYLNSFLAAAATTTREIFIGPTEISEEDLQSIVKAASHVERLIFSHCSIHCSKTLNFRSTLKYNIQFLNFQYWGDAHSEITTDWKTNASWFDNIVNAIADCGLKTSLQIVSIKENPTLKMSKVQELFNEKGMDHISIVEERLEPLNS